jgi:hypothetical protein
LKREVERQRQRNRELERELRQTAYFEIADYVEENPGTSMPQIIQHVADTVPGRVASYLDLLEEEELVVRDGRYYPQNSAPEPNNSDAQNK